MTKENIEDLYELSPLQQGILFDSLSAPDSGRYLVTMRYTIEGALDVPAFERAWHAVVARHPVLRTSFHWEGLAKPLQVVHRDIAVSIRKDDWRGIPAAELARREADEMAAESKRAFALDQGPLTRVSLVRVDDDRWLFTWSFHHVVLEGWSASLIFADLATFYAGFSRNEPVTLAPPRCYREFISWLHQQDTAGAEKYWREALAGFSEPTPLPLADSGPVRGDTPELYERRSLALDEPTVARLQALARQRHLTLNSVLQGAWALVLGRLTGTDDVAFGTVVSGRQIDLAGAESIVGLCVNTLPARVRIAPNQTVVEWLGDVHRQFVAMRAFEHTPLPQVQGWSEIRRGVPMFESIFVFENWLNASGSAAMGDLRIRTAQGIEGGTGYPLLVEIAPGPPFSIDFIYDCRRFLPPTVARLQEHFAAVLDAMAANPGGRVGDVAILSRTAEDQLRHQWNETAAPFPADLCVHELFEAQAARVPDRTALACEGEDVSYAALNRRANQLARYLRARGVGAENRVAVCLERSVDLAVALLAVLKAGGAYVPLDPSYPAERLAFMLQDSGASILLTHDRVAGASAVQSVVSLDRDAGGIARELDSNLGCTTTPANLAYVIYTSGSTGVPKGVQVVHRALTNLVASIQGTLRMDQRDVLLSVTTPSFDIFGLELYVPLVTGARVVLVDRSTAIDGRVLAQRIVECHATFMQATPATWRAMIAAGWRGARQLKVLCGGEALPEDLAADLRDRSAELWNLYGPTETTIWSTAANLSASNEPVTIGRPIANTRLFVLDSRMHPVPVGAPGELYIGGEGLARGYLQRPDVTADRFVPDPYSERGGERLYRTGDLVRYRSDGAIEYLRRVDHQVKLRGFRIELGEIESVLRTHEAVEEAVALIREDVPGDHRLVAYVLAAEDGPELATALKALVVRKLPHYMHPSSYVTLKALPRTPNGKIDRRALPAPHDERQVEDEYVAPRSGLEQRIADIWRDVLRVAEVGVHDNFFDLGGHSLLLMEVHSRLTRELGRRLPITDLFQYPTVEALARFLDTDSALPNRIAMAEARVQATQPQLNGAIAIVGLAGRFPGAGDVDAFWRNLRDGVESIRFFSVEELKAAGIDSAVLDDPRFVGARGVTDDADLFDAALFGFTPREAELLDPQQRLFLECAWEALERAGYDPSAYPGEIGVYAGSSINSYLFNVLANPSLLAELGSVQTLLTADKDHLPTRVSYKLNLRGPSINIQTACSTSLVAVHTACRAILDGECDLALAGGVSITVPLVGGHLYEQGSIMSPDGHCRAFDSRAGGTVAGSGVGIVILKRLDRAIADGDIIHAVIRGTAINNDGSVKVGYTAPSVEGQAKAIAAALAAAHIDPATIGYVEAHGTGTSLGDPIEIQALTQVYRERTDDVGYCAVGSVKTNIGHLDAAAGVAGLIKTVLALRNRELPPSLHFEQPNPQIDFAISPFFVNTALRRWPAPAGAPRRAAVSSFGLGGTNAHAILEEAPAAKPSGFSRESQLIMLSARTPTALDAAAARLADYFEQHPDVCLADAAYTLQVGRQSQGHRLALVCGSADEATGALRARDPRRTFTGAPRPKRADVVFMFPGQGSQHVGMAHGLYRTEAAFAAAFDDCAARFRAHSGVDAHDLLYGSTPTDETAAVRLKETANAQIALFAIEYALAQLWMSWGIRPDALIGHSIGEYVAACVSGVLSLDDAVALVATRAKLMSAAPAGAMLSVLLPAPRLRERLTDGLWLAAVNGPSACVVSGSLEAIEVFERALADEGIVCQRLHTGGAFHSALMSSVTAPLTAVAASITFGPPKIPYVSNVTGDWMTAAQLADPSYFARHATSTVEFAAGTQRLLDWGASVFLEVGPGQALSALVRQQSGAGSTGAGPAVIASLRHPQEDASDAMTVSRAVARLWTAGLTPDWGAYYSRERRLRVELPTYPFERQRFWVDAVPTAVQAGPLKKRPDVTEWFYLPSWKPTLTPPNPGPDIASRDVWLVFEDDCDIGRDVAGALKAHGADVVTVLPGVDFECRGRNTFALNPTRSDDYSRLFETLTAAGRKPRRVLHLWGIGGSAVLEDPTARDANRLLGLSSTLKLVPVLAAACDGGEARLVLVGTGTQEVRAADELVPEKATIVGPALVVSQEYPTIDCSLVDITIPMDLRSRGALVQALVAEASSSTDDPLVAYRLGQRFVQTYEQVRVDPSKKAGLRERGVYVILGGLGNIGLTIAEELARSAAARLVLVGRTPVPSRDRWNDPHEPATTRRIERLRALDGLGGDVLTLCADVADPAALSTAFDEAERRFGALHGVIHAAGSLVGPGIDLIERLGEEGIAEQLRAKVDGLYALEQALGGRDVEFCLLTSSLSTVLGGFTYSAYAAANAFMDAFASSRNRAGTVSWKTVDWDGWNFGLGDAVKKGLGEFAMTPAEAQDAFSRIVGRDLPTRIAVSTGDLNARRRRYLLRAPAAGLQHERPALAQSYVAPRNDIEAAIAGVWRDLFGIEQIGAFDNFFDLGGHSLLATQLASRLRRAFSIELPLASIFDSPTVAGLADLVFESLLEQEGAAGSLLDDVERLAPSESSRELSGSGTGV
jgi:amino acid adenylation domain-containing protein